MRKNIIRSFSSVAAFVALLLGAVPSQATLIETLYTAPGTDLSNVHVGDILKFVTRGSSDVDPNEYLTEFPDVHFFADSDIVDFVNIQSVASWSHPWGTTPSLVLWTLKATAAGTVDVWNGFSDCNGLPNDTTGCAITNLGATRPADSNHIVFTIYDVPEPASIGIVSLGLVALGWSTRKKSRGVSVQ
jgi:hypothetical protein